MNRRNLLLGMGGVTAAGAGFYLAGRGPDHAAAAAALRSPRSARSNADLPYLVHHAVLAANSHNTQPWRFAGGPRQIAITPDFSRATPVVDPDNHHLFASLGCAAENMALAAAAAGSRAEIAFAGDLAGLRVALEPGPPVVDPLFAAIPRRQCTRTAYDGRAASSADLATLERVSAVPGCRVMIITDTAQIGRILELIVAANTSQIEDPQFVRELKTWIRFNPASAIASGDGLYVGSSGNPTLPTWLGNLLFERVLSADGENAKCISQVRSSSGLAIFVSDRNDPAHWVQAGRSYQRFALQATALGLKHAFLNQPVEVAQFRPRLAGLLGIGPLRPDLLVRFGYGPDMPYSLRRPVAAVLAEG